MPADFMGAGFCGMMAARGGGFAVAQQAIKLDMYGSALSDPFFAALATYLRDGLDPRPSGLLLGQICGIEFAHAPLGQYQYLGSFSLPGFAPGHYNSVLITGVATGLHALSDFDAENHPVAINELGSFSGSIAFAAHMLGRGDARFPRQVMTGGHLRSVAAVARGDAMLAAIDRLSFNLAQQVCPEDYKGVRVIGETASRPGLPFVCGAAVPDDQVAVMQERLAATPRQPFWDALSGLLGVDGIDRINPADFMVMRDV